MPEDGPFESDEWRDMERRAHDELKPVRQVGGTHYHDMPISPFAIIDAFKLGFYDGNVLKYLLRAGRKPGVSRMEDLEKAEHYLAEMIERERTEAGYPPRTTPAR